MIVLDTNVIAYLYIRSALSAAAESALRKDRDWMAPLLWRSELCNDLVQYVRAGRISLDDARQFVGQALVLMHGQEFAVRPDQVMRLAAESGCSAYGCEFVVLATNRHVPLVTMDREILSRFPDVAVSLTQFVDV